MDQDEECVRRRRWSRDEKPAIVKEATTSGNVIGTAKRHRIQAQQIDRWRDRLFGSAEPAGLLPFLLPPIHLQHFQHRCRRWIVHRNTRIRCWTA